MLLITSVLVCWLLLGLISADYRTQRDMSEMLLVLRNLPLFLGVMVDPWVGISAGLGVMSSQLLGGRARRNDYGFLIGGWLYGSFLRALFPLSNALTAGFVLMTMSLMFASGQMLHQLNGAIPMRCAMLLVTLGTFTSANFLALVALIEAMCWLDVLDIILKIRGLHELDWADRLREIVNSFIKSPF